jgi:ubiquinone/menaquinone biosynthesis C-methylase UbiE
MKHLTQQVQYQRQYYNSFAGKFDTTNILVKDHHYFALAALEGLLDFYECTSLLDIGAGTGRVVRYLKQRKPEMKVMGIEPVAGMRQQAYRNGVLPSDLIAGDATHLPFSDGSFDVVTDTGVLHHIPKPERAIAEMLRVANKLVLISDSNNMGQGSSLARMCKQALKAFGLWPLAYYIRYGKEYWTSDGDGLAYPFSVFDHYALIRQHCQSVHITNTQDAGINPYRSASHVALLGVKTGSPQWPA